MVLLADGDITKKQYILENITLSESVPFIKFKMKRYFLVEGILKFFGYEDKEKISEDYCGICKRANLNKDCSTCSRKIEIECQKTK